jgi:hypothetical protein
VRTKFEHFLGSTPATGLFDIEYNLMLRDYRQQHSLPYYSRYWNIILGERSKLFSFGTTTVKLSMKLYENYNPERNALSPAFSLTQNVRIGERDLSNTFTYDFLRARNDLNDEQNFKFVHSMEFTSIMPKIDFTPTLTWSAKDTMKQKGTRGIEVLVNPTLALNYNYTDNWNFSAEYGLSKNFSRAKATYQYTQHDIKFGALYDF